MKKGGAKWKCPSRERDLETVGGLAGVCVFEISDR